MQKPILIAVLTGIGGAVLGALISWSLAYNRGLASFVRSHAHSDLGWTIILAERLCEADTNGVSFMLELKIDTEILKFDEISRVGSLDEIEQAVFSKALEYRRRHPFEPDEYTHAGDGILRKRIAQVLADHPKKP